MMNNSEIEIKIRLTSYFEIISAIDWCESSRGDDWLDIIWEDIILPYVKTLDHPLKYFVKYVPMFARDYCFRYMSKVYYNDAVDENFDEEIKVFLADLNLYSDVGDKVNSTNIVQFEYYTLKFHYHE